MKKKFVFTSFVFLVCLVVFIYVNAKPSAMDTRFQAIAYEGDTVIEEGITIRLVGDLQENVISKDKYTGTLTITSENFPVSYDVEMEFDKNGIGEFQLLSNDEEYGILTLSKDFETVCIEVTNQEITGGKTIYIAAPATNLQQAQEITNKYFQ